MIVQATQQLEKCYTVSEVANLLQVTPQIVYKWLDICPPDGWFRTPGGRKGRIRIKESLLIKLQKGEI